MTWLRLGRASKTATLPFSKRSLVSTLLRPLRMPRRIRISRDLTSSSSATWLRSYPRNWSKRNLAYSGPLSSSSESVLAILRAGASPRTASSTEEYLAESIFSAQATISLKCGFWLKHRRRFRNSSEAQELARASKNSRNSRFRRSKSSFAAAVKKEVR